MNTILLPAENAVVNGALKILDTPLAHTIHYWHNTNDTISWSCDVKHCGDYKVTLHYSLEERLAGGLIAIWVAEERLLFEAVPTKNWNNFQSFEAGIITIKETGTVRVWLQVLQMPAGENSAMPDIHWLQLVQTNTN